MSKLLTLVSGVNKREDKAFETLFSLFYKELVYFSTQLQGSSSESEDIVHDIFIQLWESSYRFDELRAIRAFLYTLVRNKTINHIKRRGKSINDLSEITREPDQELILSSIIDTEVLSIISKAINQLPAGCAKIIKLVMEGHSSAEISVMLNLAPSTVRTQKRIGITKLRELLPPDIYMLIF